MSSVPELTPTTTIVRIPEQVSGVIDGKVVILSIAAGEYYNMNEMGTRIWGLLEKPTTLTALVDTLLAEYAVERATCEKEAHAFVAQLLKDKLLKIVPASA